MFINLNNLAGGFLRKTLFWLCYNIFDYTIPGYVRSIDKEIVKEVCTFLEGVVTSVTSWAKEHLTVNHPMCIIKLHMVIN